MDEACVSMAGRCSLDPVQCRGGRLNHPWRTIYLHGLSTSEEGSEGPSRSGGQVDGPGLHEQTQELSFLEKGMGKLQERGYPGMKEEVLVYIDKLISSGRGKTIEDEAIHVRTHLRGGPLVKPMGVLKQLVTQSDLNELASNHPAWLGKVYGYEDFPTCRFILKKKWKASTCCINASFQPSKEMKNGAKKVTGIVPGQSKVVPSLELLLATIETLVEKTRCMRGIYRILNKKLWFSSRRIIYFLTRFLQARRNALKPNRKAPPLQRKLVRASTLGMLLEKHLASEEARNEVMEVLGKFPFDLVWDIPQLSVRKPTRISPQVVAPEVQMEEQESTL